jgi:glycerol-3-phosphate dehydrogenase
LRGLRTVLVDAQDLCAGTSGASSRLIHGGIRYLEHGELRLVHESLRERELLLRAAPHLVKPYPLLIPFYRHNRRSRTVIRLGMIAYDLLSLRKSTPRHSILSRAEVLLRYPGLDRDGLTGAALYYDAQIPLAERLGVELAVDAAALGADVLTHWAVTSIRKASHGMDVGLHDALTGRNAMVRAAGVVNCAGPGVDAVLAMIGDAADHARLVRGSKGSHLLVPRFPGAPGTGVHYEARSDGRAVLVLPIGDDCLIGATDTFVDGDPADAVCTDDDVRYLLDEVNQLLPQARLTPEHIVRTWCGVRPLPYSPDSASTAEISRDHHVVAHPALPGLFSVVGGKLTTHRALGELVLRRIARDVPTLAVRAGSRRASQRRRLPGGRCASWPDFADLFRRTAGLDTDVAERLLRVYGVRAREVVALARTRPETATRIPGTAALGAEVVLAVEGEFARTLIDVMHRRLMLSRHNDLGLGCVESVAGICREVVGWDDARTGNEVDAYRRWVRASTLAPEDRQSCGG